MENRIADNFRAYSALRNKLLERIITKLPIAAEYSSTFHSVTVVTSVICIVAIYAQLRALTLFSLHPTCMIIGCFLFLSEGIVAYHNRSLLETLSPIMQHNKKTKVRTLHATIQIIGSTFLGLGLLFIVANKVEFKRSLVPMTVHSVLGCFTLLLILVQIVTGYQKIAQLDKNNSKIRRWHGDLGLLVWDMLCLTALSGMAGFFIMSFTHLLVEATVLVQWLAVHVQFRRKISERSSTAGDDEGVDHAALQPLTVGDDFALEPNRSV